MVFFHPCRDVRQAAWDPCSYRWIIWSKWDIELCVISVEMVGEAMCLYDGTQWFSVCGEKEGSKNRSLGNPSDNWCDLDTSPPQVTLKVKGCIKQQSKRNDDSVSVEELDWSAESQVLIPAEHFWCDFKCRPWAKNSYGYYIWVQSFHTLQICSNRGGNTIFKNMNYVSIFVATVWKCPFSLLKNILYRLIFF